MYWEALKDENLHQQPPTYLLFKTRIFTQKSKNRIKTLDSSVYVTDSNTRPELSVGLGSVMILMMIIFRQDFSLPELQQNMAGNSRNWSQISGWWFNSFFCARKRNWKMDQKMDWKSICFKDMYERLILGGISVRIFKKWTEKWTENWTENWTEKWTEKNYCYWIAPLFH